MSELAPLQSGDNDVASQSAGLGLIFGRVNFLIEGFSGSFPSMSGNLGHIRPFDRHDHPKPYSPILEATVADLRILLRAYIFSGIFSEFNDFEQADKSDERRILLFIWKLK